MLLLTVQTHRLEREIVQILKDRNIRKTDQNPLLSRFPRPDVNSEGKMGVFT